MNVLTAVFITDGLYRVDLHGEFVAHGVDPMMAPKQEGRAVAMVDKATLRAMHAELGAVLAGRPAPTTAHLKAAAAPARTHVEVAVADLNPEDFA